MITTKVFFIIVALVFTPCRSKAAPHQPEPNLDIESSAQPPPTVNKDSLSGMDVTEPPATKPKLVNMREESTYFYPYSTSMGPRIGLLFDSERIAKQWSPLVVLGFFYKLNSISANHIVAGADLQSDSTGAINGLIEHTYSPSEKFRPFVKGGLSLLIQPDKGMANLVDYNNYRVRIGAGIEDLLQDPASLRWDFEATVGLTGYAANIIFGYSWAW